MSRNKHVAASLGLCMCLVWLGGTAVAQGPPGGTSFTCSNSTQCVQANQSGAGASSPLNANSAVRGQATSATGSNAGVIGTAAGANGFGVGGFASGTPGSGKETWGVIGYASGASGKTRGIAGLVDSPNGIAVSANSHNGGDLFQGASGPAGSELTKFRVDAGGNTTMAGSLFVNGGALVQGSITSNGNFSAIGAISADTAHLTGGLSVDSDSSFGNSLSVAGTLSVQGPVNGGAGNFFSLAVGGGSSFAGPVSAASIAAGSSVINGNLVVTGGFAVIGTKSSLAQLPDGREVALYAVESPENWFEDFGTAKLQHGVARVTIEPIFGETVNSDLSYHVFLTPDGNCRGLYIAKKTPSGFEVRELGGGKSNVSFDYRVVVKRKGFEKLRLAEVPSQPGQVLAQSKGAGVSAH